MANLFKSLKPTAQLGKSGFDLSQKHVFSTKPGQAVPCLFVETVPDDNFQISLASLTRTMTFETAAFVRGKFRYDFFFVPYSQLWHNFNQFISQRQDKHSSLSKGSMYVPTIDLGNILMFAWHVTYSSASIQNNVYRTDMFGVPFLHNVIRILDMCGYGNHRALIGMSESEAGNYTSFFFGKSVNVLRIAAYQHIWYDFYRNKYYDLHFTSQETPADVGYLDGLPDYVNMFNFDDIDCSSFANSQIPVVPNSTQWNARENIRLYMLFGMKYVQWKKDLFTSVMPGTQFGAVSTVDVIGNGDVTINGSVTLNGTTGSDLNRWSNMDSQQFIPYTTVVTGNSSGSSNSLVQDSSTRTRIIHDHSINGSASIDTSGRVTDVISSFDVLALKRAEALQAWKQNTLRAGNMTDDAFRAHYGVEPYYEGDENVNFLGSYEAILQVNSVEATASTDGSVNGSVGDLAAIGTASAHGETINFHCKDFGVIVCISSFVPESEYNNLMIDKANRLYEPFDFFTPEYQNIGLESVSGVDLNASLYSNSLNEVIGYAPRYFMYKTAVDKVHNQFSKSAVLSKVGSSFAYREVKGDLSHWVNPREDMYTGIIAGDVQRLLSSFYVNPSVLNNSFGILVDGTDSTDTFLHNVFFDIKAVRPMSVLGLPNF